jgi:hypothetical protein
MIDNKTGKFEFTNNAGFGFRIAEDCTLEEAREFVLDAYPEFVEYDAGYETWFYEDQDAYDRDENNADLNRGVIATWKEA